jgi:capsular polysaccharide transport system permease protein
MADSQYSDDETDPDRLQESKRLRQAGKGRNGGKGQNKLERDEHFARAPQTLPEPVVIPPSILSRETSEQIELLLRMRSHRLRRFLLRFIIFVGLPTLAVLFYTTMIATPQYVCNFEITYQVYQPSTTLTGGLVPSIVGSSITDSVDYGTLLYEYIRSPTLATQINAQLNLREQFSKDHIDWFSRLKPHASDVDFLAFWRQHVSVSEGFGGFLMVSVQGFDPHSTLAIANAINLSSDNMIDSLTERARRAEVDVANGQLKQAEAELRQADTTLTAFRNAHGDLDPNFVATQLATVAGALEAQLATARAELAQAQGLMQPASPQVIQLKLQVAALQQQIDNERRRLANSSGQGTYSNTVAHYQALLLDQQFASDAYQAAQQSLSIAQADTARKQNYVVDFVSPVLPDKPSVPNPFTSSVTAFLICIVAYGIGNLLFSAFRDQTGV